MWELEYPLQPCTVKAKWADNATPKTRREFHPSGTCIALLLSHKQVRGDLKNFFRDLNPRNFSEHPPSQ